MTRYSERQRHLCKRCFFFYEVLTNIAGVCVCRQSDHFEHLITRNHPACSFYKVGK